MEILIAVLVALIGALGGICAAIISKKLTEIHVLVNSRLEIALNDIKVLKAALLKAEEGEGK